MTTTTRKLLPLVLLAFSALGRAQDLKLPAGVEIVPVAANEGQLAPTAIVAALFARGFRRILIEGGADTVSRFLAARCLDRLHVVIAPIIIGAGPSSVTLPPIARVEEALRAPIRAHILGEELLVDCGLSAQRAPIGVFSGKVDSGFPPENTTT